MSSLSKNHVAIITGTGISGKIGKSSYTAAKEGIRGMSRVVANEWGPLGIRVNVICPLAMTPHLQQWKYEYPDLYKETIKNIPLKRFGDPEKDIGRACIFLASEDAEFITGQTLDVQDGCELRP